MKRIAISVLLILAALVLSGCGGHRLSAPSIDISGAQLVTGDGPVVDGITFEETSAYVLRHPTEELSVRELRGRCIAYYVNDSRYIFFCESKDLDPSEWLIRIPDNGRGSLQWEDACWIKAENVRSIPPWLEMRDTGQ